MDFEIEEDDDPYQFDWDDNDAPKSQNKSKPKSSFFSAGNDEDEYNYDYNFSKANNSKKKSVVYDEPIPAFSPVASNRGSANSSMPNSTQSRDNPNLTAMEKAKSMLNKYSNKSFDQPKSNFKNRKPDTLFDEDEISISDDDDSGSKYKVKNVQYFYLWIDHI